MKNNIFEKIIGIGLLIIVIVFNPFVFAGLYVDSTNSYSFIASNKIYFLGILNAVLLLFWILKIRATKELNIVSSKIYIPVILWMVSGIVSYFLSVNRINSLYGYNFTLENSLIESGMVFIFFIIFINNIRTKEELENVLRYFMSGVSISLIYLIIRYAGTWTTNIEYLRDYFNVSTFSLTGHIGTVPILAISMFVLGLGLIISDLTYDRSKTQLVIDSINVVISGAVSFMLLNIGGIYPEYLHLIVLLILVGIVLYLVFTNLKLKQTLIPILALVGLSAVFGLGLYFGLTKNASQPQVLPNVSLDATWNITLDSIKSPVERGLWGNGQGNYTYFFDYYKSEATAIAQLADNNKVITNFTINAQAPSVEEIRSYQPGSYFLNVLFSQGLFGLAAFILLLIMTVTFAVKKGILSTNIMSFVSLIVFVTVMIFTIFLRYDFMLVLLLWLLLAIHTVSINEDEPQKNLIISLSGRYIDLNNNMNYLVPSVFLLLVLLTLFSTFKIFPGNYYLYEAKLAQIKGDLNGYQSKTNDALKALDVSDLAAREYVYSRDITLLEEYQKLQKKVEENPDYKNSDEYKNKLTQLVATTQNLGRILDNASAVYPTEYKNYFLQGFILSKISEMVGLSFDQTAEKYLTTSRNLNRFHPETLYELAKIYARHNDLTNAYSSITPAVSYRPDNLFYQALNADILKNIGNYQNALTIYKELKRVKDANPDNQQIQDFYKQQDIDKDIEESEKGLKEQQEKAQQTSQSSSNSSKN